MCFESKQTEAIMENVASFPRPEIQRELEALQYSTTRLKEIIQRASERLSPALVSLPVCPKSELHCVPATSDIGKAIQASNALIFEMCSDVEGVLERLAI